MWQSITMSASAGPSYNTLGVRPYSQLACTNTVDVRVPRNKLDRSLRWNVPFFRRRNTEAKSGIKIKDNSGQHKKRKSSRMLQELLLK